jgi:putative hemolysin
LEVSGPQVVALLAGAAAFFFSLAESAIVHYSPPRLVELARKRNRDGPVPSFIATDERALLACQAGAILAIVALVLAVGWWLAGGFVAGPWPAIGAGAVATGVLLTFVRLLPVFLGRMYPEPVLLSIRPAVVGVTLALYPLVWFLSLFRRITERLAGRKIAGEGPDHLEDEIMSAVEEGEMEGLIREEEANMIERALHLRDADVADVMMPRTRMFALDIGTPVADAVKRVSEAGHSRVPVYRKNLDEIVGLLYAKDLLRYWETEQAKTLTLSRLARKPFFVPETKKISHLLEEFKRQKKHMAIVLDEYGGTAGLITIEDILEELVGEIEDEFDESVDLPLLRMIGDAEAEVDARVHVHDLADALETEIDSEEFDTVGGLVFTALGRVPAIGDETDFAGLHFIVLDANERSVNRVRVTRSPS